MKGGVPFPSLMERLSYDTRAQATADGYVGFVFLVQLESVLVSVSYVISVAHINHVFKPVLNYKDPSELAPPLVGQERAVPSLLER